MPSSLEGLLPRGGEPLFGTTRQKELRSGEMVLLSVALQDLIPITAMRYSSFNGNKAGIKRVGIQFSDWLHPHPTLSLQGRGK